MIERLKGTILEKHPPLVLLEIYGITYEVYMPITYFYKLPKIGQEAIIFTHFLIRESTQLLFGFIHKQERTLFRELIKVNNIGTKLALAILSNMSVQEFISAIEHQKFDTLVELPGVGKKTAERLIVEMKGRFEHISKNIIKSKNIKELTTSINKQNKLLINPRNEAIAALIALGYKHQEANQMINKVIYTDANNCEILIRAALRNTL